MKSMKQKLAIMVSALALLVVPAFAPVYVGAQSVDNSLECGAEFELTPGGDCESSAEEGTENIQTAIRRIVDILSIIVGIIAVIMIIFGGLRYITSGGDSSKVGSAKNTIIYAIVGLVIVAFAQFIVQFVLRNINTET